MKLMKIVNSNSFLVSLVLILIVLSGIGIYFKFKRKKKEQFENENENTCIDDPQHKLSTKPGYKHLLSYGNSGIMINNNEKDGNNGPSKFIIFSEEKNGLVIGDKDGNIDNDVQILGPKHTKAVSFGLLNNPTKEAPEINYRIGFFDKNNKIIVESGLLVGSVSTNIKNRIKEVVVCLNIIKQNNDYIIDPNLITVDNNDSRIIQPLSTPIEIPSLFLKLVAHNVNKKRRLIFGVLIGAITLIALSSIIYKLNKK